MPNDGHEQPDVRATDSAPEAVHGSVGPPDVAVDRAEQVSAAEARIPLDLVAGLALLCIVAVFLLNAGGDDPLDWIFPQTLSYTLAIIGVYLTVRGLLGFGHKTDTLLPILHGRGVDVLVFTVLAVITVALVPVVGFWTMTALMLCAGSVYLDHARSRKRIALSAVVALAVCVAAYLLLVLVLYVPIPPEPWLPG